LAEAAKFGLDVVVRPGEGTATLRQALGSLSASPRARAA